MQLIGTLLFLIGIVGLFLLNRDAEDKPSKALWLPVCWLLIIGSRPISAWLNGGGISESVGFEDGSPLDRDVYLLLIILALWTLFRRSPEVIRIARNSWPILLYFVYCAASVIWSDYPEVAAKRWFKAIGDLAMVGIVLTDSNVTAATKKLLSRIGFILLPASVLLIKYYPDLGRAYSRWEGTAFYVGVAADKNMLGMTSMMLGLGALWHFVREFKAKRRKRILLAQGVIVGMAFWLISTANSMTSLSCFVFGCGLVVAATFRSFECGGVRLHTAVALILLVSGATLFMNFGGGVLREMGRNPTLTGRTELWRQIIKIDKSPWYGYGYESFWSPTHVNQLANVLKWEPNEAHNGYLEVFANLGWLGVAVLAFAIAMGYRTVLQSLRQGQQIAQLKLAYFVVGLVYSFTEAGFRNLTPIWIAFLFAVASVSDYHPLRNNQDPLLDRVEKFRRPPISSAKAQETVRPELATRI